MDRGDVGRSVGAPPALPRTRGVPPTTTPMDPRFPLASLSPFSVLSLATESVPQLKGASPLALDATRPPPTPTAGLASSSANAVASSSRLANEPARSETSKRQSVPHDKEVDELESSSSELSDVDDQPRPDHQARERDVRPRLGRPTQAVGTAESPRIPYANPAPRRPKTSPKYTRAPLVCTQCRRRSVRARDRTKEGRPELTTCELRPSWTFR